MERLLRKSVMVLMALALALGAWGVMPVERVAAADCTSTKTGNWNDTTVWSCGAVPSGSDNVTIESSHTVTVNVNSEVNDIKLLGSTGTRLILNSTLTIYGTLNGGTPSTTFITGTGTARFVGSSRALFGTSWAANPPNWNLEIALDNNAIGTASTNVKAGNITITSGTFDLGTYELRPDAGTNQGTLTISSGATLITARLSRIGTANTPFASFTNNGTLKVSQTTFVWPTETNCNFSANSAVEYTRAGDQTVQTPKNSSYGHLILSGSGIKTVPSGLLIQSNFTINENVTAVIPTDITVNGAVINDGGLRQTQIVNNQTITFLNISTDKYYGVDITTTGNMGDTTVTVWGNQACADTQNTVLRCFDISPTTPQGAEITLYYRDAEENGQTAANIWHFSGGNWVQATDITRGGTGEGKWVKGTVTAFSPFTLSDNNPTAVDLTDFSAVWDGDAVAVSWETAQELDNLGFNLYRGESAAGPWTRLNAELIPTQNPGAVFGATYTWLDENVTPGATYFYRLEDVDIYGVSTFHGPVSTAPVDPSAVALSAFGARGPAFGLPLALAALGLWGLARKRRS